MPSGLADGVARLGGLDEVAVVGFSSSDIVRHRLVARIVDAYLKDNPAELTMWDTVLILRAFVNAFPCR